MPTELERRQVALFLMSQVLNLNNNIQQIFLVLYVTLNRYLPAGLKFLLKTHSTEFNIDATGP